MAICFGIEASVVNRGEEIKARLNDEDFVGECKKE